jgi:perosamine synthetase
MTGMADPAQTYADAPRPDGDAPADPTIPVFRPYYDEREETAVLEVLRSGWLGLGPKTEAFEQRFAERVGARYGVALNSATAALHIGLQLLGVGPGDEVLVPTMTFVSTAMAAQYLGATPVICDIEPENLALDFGDAARRTTADTRAMIAVLYGGKPLEAPETDVPILYDCAHATGADWSAAGKLCCWSFHAVKNLATGDGGMLTTDDEETYLRARRLRWLGIDKSTWDRSGEGEQYWWEYKIDEVGYKAHMNDLAAALGLVQLAKLDEMQEIRHRIARQYLEELAGIPGLELPEYDPDSSWHMFVVRTEHRNALSMYLQARGISTGVHYKPIHLYPLYNQYPLPVAERVWPTILTLPLFPALESAHVSRICTTIRSALTELS